MLNVKIGEMSKHNEIYNMANIHYGTDILCIPRFNPILKDKIWRVQPAVVSALERREAPVSGHRHISQ